jgi:hypothetical protein
MDEFTFNANFESAATRGNQLRFDSSEVANLSRQTGGPRFVVSDLAIFDRNVCFHVILLARILCRDRRMGQVMDSACLEGFEPPTF